MANNVTYDSEYDMREFGEIQYEPAALVYERGIDDANGYAVLECHILEQNGWDALQVPSIPILRWQIFMPAWTGWKQTARSAPSKPRQ